MATGSFVGRDAELAAIEAAFETALTGRPAVVLVSGEPGIGKSSLLAAAAERLEGEARVLYGFALEAESTPPYFALDRVFDPVLRELAATSASTMRAVLAAAGIGTTPAEAPPLVRLPPDAEQIRLFDALAELCSGLAEAHPLVVVLDDMQWAAPATWDCLVYAVRAVRERRLLFLLAAREEMLRQTATVAARAVAEFSRLRLLTHIPLQPLAEPALVRLASEALGGPVAAGLGSALAGRSGGNPFLAEEVLQDYRSRGQIALRGDEWDLREELPLEDEPPLTLRLALGLRLDPLPAGCEEVLACAAVIGRSCSVRLLAATAGLDPDAVTAALRPAELAGLVDPQRGGWTFRHDLIRESVLDRNRHSLRRLHAAAATAIGQTAGFGPGLTALAALAYHWRMADDAARAVPAALAAAAAATAGHAPAEALTYARSAHELCAQLDASSGPPDLGARAALAHGEAALACAEHAEAEEALRAAQHEAAVLGDSQLEGQIWARLGALYRQREAPVEAHGCFETALARLDDGTDRTEVAEVLIALCDLEGLTRARYEEAEAAGARALDIAVRLHDPGLEARATLALANSQTRATDPRAARPHLLRTLELALIADDPALAADVCAGLSNSYYWTGELREAERYGQQRLGLARRSGDVYGMRHAHSWLALLAFSRGEWERVRSLLREAEAVLSRLDSPEPVAFLRVVEGITDYRCGALDAAYGRLREALDLFARVDPATMLWYAGTLALVCAESGRLDEARSLVAAQEARLYGLPAAALPARSARNMLLLAYVALGDLDGARRCEGLLRPFAGDLHWSTVRLSLASAAALRGDRDAALEDLTVAERWARDEGARPDLALALLARAKLQGGTEDGPLAEACALFEALGMERELARARGLRSEPPRASGGLSPREIEVLTLVAGGMTNREIASTLVISERTVVNHISHIFNKLGVENRAAATAYALRNGLA